MQVAAIRFMYFLVLVDILQVQKYQQFMNWHRRGAELQEAEIESKKGESGPKSLAERRPSLIVEEALDPKTQELRERQSGASQNQVHNSVALRLKNLTVK